MWWAILIVVIIVYLILHFSCPPVRELTKIIVDILDDFF